MKDIMEAMMFFAVTFAAIQILSASRISYLCDRGEYYNRDKMDCIQCSGCPANQVPLRTCWKDQDTVCGTIGKFEFRQLPPSSVQQTVAKESLRSETDDTDQLPVPNRKTIAVEEDVSSDTWFIVTLVLAALLVVMCIIGVILIFITCHVCKKTKREIVCDPVFTSSLLRPEEQTLTGYFKVVTQT